MGPPLRPLLERRRREEVNRRHKEDKEDRQQHPKHKDLNPEQQQQQQQATNLELPALERQDCQAQGPTVAWARRRRRR